MVFLTRRHLSRRALLRGAGAALSLPFLESMLPAGVAKAAATAASTTLPNLCCRTIASPAGAVITASRPAVQSRTRPSGRPPLTY